METIFDETGKSKNDRISSFARNFLFYLIYKKQILFFFDEHETIEYNSKEIKVRCKEMRSAIRIDNLNFAYGTQKIFSHFSLEIEEGKIVSIVGPNNCGKTTLMKLIGGFLPNKDAIVIGYSYLDNEHIKDSAKQIGVVLSDLDHKFLFEDVYQELAFPLENLQYSKEAIQDSIAKLSQELEMEDLLDKKINDLTKEEQQILFFAIALLHKPRILILDQPFSMMNKDRHQKLLNYLKQLNKRDHTTIVLATSNLEDCLIADEMIVLNHGEIYLRGAPLEVMKEDQKLIHLGLELPFMVDLSLKLQFYELLDDIILDMEGMVNTLWK